MSSLVSRIILASIFGLFLAISPAHGEAELDKEIALLLSKNFSSSRGLKIDGFDSKVIDAALMRWYQPRAYQPIWFESGAPSKRIVQAVDVINASFSDGLNPNDYFVSQLRDRIRGNEISNKAEFDLIMTLAVVKLAYQARNGRYSLRKLDSESFDGPKVTLPGLYEAGQDVLFQNEIGQALQEQFPVHRQYRRMKVALESYRKLQLRGGWGVVPIKGPPLRIGTFGERVEALANRLQITGELLRAQRPYGRFDQELEAAVKRFQHRHGLPTSGEAREKTLAALNVPIADRINELLINLERWRWLVHDFSEGKEVYVNLAGYELFAIENSEIQLRLPVIVGKPYSASPVFSELIKYIEVNPYWNVPTSIAVNETLRDQQKNQNYLTSHHMRLYDGSGNEISPAGIKWSEVSKSQMRSFSVKQDPGPWNVLGSLKFVFPNKYSVYLHDTGSPSLFAQNERALSHGCIRVSNPIALAVFLLDTPADPWTTDRVKEVIAEGRNKNVKLPVPIRLYLTYRTTWVDLDGTVNFRPDIYNRDQRMLSLFRQN